MASRISDFLLHPDSFFGKLAAGPDEYMTPLLIVGTCMVLDAVRQFLLADWMRQVILPLMPSVSGMPEIGSFISGMISILLFVSVVENIPAFIAYWLIITAVFTIVSQYFSQEGTIYKMIIATGWGMAPLIVYNAVVIPLFLLYRNAMSLTISPEAFNQTSSRYSRGSSIQSSFNRPDYSDYIHVNGAYVEFHQIEFVLFALALLACCIFWVYGVRNIRNISVLQAAVSVVLPVTVFLIGILGIKIMNGWL